MKPTYRKSWAGNLLMWSDLTLNPSFNIKRGQPNLKVLITPLLLILEVGNVKPTHRKSWGGDLLMLLDLTFGPSFKVNGSLTLMSCFCCGFTFSIGSPMRRSSFFVFFCDHRECLRKMQKHIHLSVT